MKRILFIAAIVLLAAEGQAQRRYDDILRQVENGSPVLQAARQKCEASQQEAHVGLLLPDPEVDVALFRGDPAEQGTRWDLRVTQSFEMPSVGCSVTGAVSAVSAWLTAVGSKSA